jgi:hypothetical protein
LNTCIGRGSIVVRPPSSVQVKLDLKLASISGTWEPNNAERRAAWELYVELITRIAVVPLEYGVLREALTSLHSLFDSSREVLRRYGPTVAEPRRDGQYNLGYLVVVMLNYAVRPVLAYWHPELQAWEADRPTGRAQLEHELAWPRVEELRGALDETRRHLAAYAALLAAACGVPDLGTTIPPPRPLRYPK